MKKTLMLNPEARMMLANAEHATNLAIKCGTPRFDLTAELGTLLAKNNDVMLVTLGDLLHDPR